MTVTYTHEVADCKGFGCFWKLLFRWRGSIYKLIWPDLLLYTIFYFTLSFVYRFALDGEGRVQFERASLYCQYFTDLIPLSFVLGFYVSIVVQRWWAQWETLPWPDTLALFVSTTVSGQDTRGRMMRRAIMRYANLAFVLTFAMVSPCVKKRFPTLDHLVEAGLMLANERKIYSAMREKTSHPIYWMPLAWAGALVTRARKEGRIKDDFAVKTIIDEITRVRGQCGSLLGYDWVSIPLVYTQVVTLAVYSFFLSTLMGRQFLDPSKGYTNNTIDFYLPIFTYLQFFFYMGWLKVAESLVNPFGEDDDDFEINWLVDRNLQVSYLIVDEMHNEHPELIQDMYWDEVVPQELPYTVAAQEFKPTEPHLGSTANIEVSQHDMELLPVLEENEEDEETGGLHRTNSKLSDNSGGFQMPQINSVISFLAQKLKPSNPSSIERSSVAGSMSSMQKPALVHNTGDQVSQQLRLSTGSVNSVAGQASHDCCSTTEPSAEHDHGATTDKDVDVLGEDTSWPEPSEHAVFPKKLSLQMTPFSHPFKDCGSTQSSAPDESIARVPRRASSAFQPSSPGIPDFSKKHSATNLKLIAQNLRAKPSTNRLYSTRPFSQGMDGSLQLQMKDSSEKTGAAMDARPAGKAKSASDILKGPLLSDSPASTPPSSPTQRDPDALGERWITGSHTSLSSSKGPGNGHSEDDLYNSSDAAPVLSSSSSPQHVGLPTRRGFKKHLKELEEDPAKGYSLPRPNINIDNFEFSSAADESEQEPLDTATTKERSRSSFRSTSIYKPLTPHQTRQFLIPTRGIGQFLQSSPPLYHRRASGLETPGTPQAQERDYRATPTLTEESSPLDLCGEEDIHIAWVETEDDKLPPPEELNVPATQSGGPRQP